MFPTRIETARLVLRKPERRDAGTIFHAYAQDLDVTRYLLWRPHASVETTRRFIAECMAGWGATGTFPYVITRKEDDELLGMIELRTADHRASFGYAIGKQHWGHGYVPEALTRLVELALAVPAIYRIDAMCDAANTASARALEKAGFVREGLLKRYMVHPNVSDEPRDSFIYAITK